MKKRRVVDKAADDVNDSSLLPNGIIYQKKGRVKNKAATQPANGEAVVSDESGISRCNSKEESQVNKQHDDAHYDAASVLLGLMKQ
jgi:hypothetical protein